MSNWTPEARKYFEGYLDQVSALAESRGDDADDIVSDLREHVEQKVEDSGGKILTLEQLTAILTAIGTPQQVVDGGIAFDEDPVASAATSTASTASRAQGGGSSKGRSVLTCAIIALGFVLLALIGVPVLLVTLRFVAFQHSEVISGSAQVNAYWALQELHKAQKDFQQSEIVDVNQDGIGDYGTIEQLHEASHYHDVFRKMGYATGYEFTIEVTPGDEDTEPGFTCIAQGVTSLNPSDRDYFMDQTGVIRYTEHGTIPTADSKPQWEAE